MHTGVHSIQDLDFFLVYVWHMQVALPCRLANRGDQSIIMGNVGFKRVLRSLDGFWYYVYSRVVAMVAYCTYLT